MATKTAAESAAKPAAHAYAKTIKTFRTASGKEGKFFSLPQLAKSIPNVSRLPISIRIVLESVLRNCDGKKVTDDHVQQIAGWGATAERTEEIPFCLLYTSPSPRD